MSERGLDRVVDLLWSAAEGGSVSAQKVLYDHYRRDADASDAAQDDWTEIYGDGNSPENVTPLRRAG